MFPPVDCSYSIIGLEGGMELSVVNPGLVLGPPLTEQDCTSVEVRMHKCHVCSVLLLLVMVIVIIVG